MTGCTPPKVEQNLVTYEVSKDSLGFIHADSLSFTNHLLFDPLHGHNASAKIVKGSQYFENYQINLNTYNHPKIWSILVDYYVPLELLNTSEYRELIMICRVYYKNQLLYSTQNSTSVMRSTQLRFDIPYIELSSIPEGSEQVKVKLDGKWEDTNKKAVQVHFTDSLMMVPIYKTKFEVSSFKLNEKQCDAVLGSNDFSNPAPEPKFTLALEDQYESSTYLSNTYIFNHHETIYFKHYSMNPILTISIYDVDYIFNANDLISTYQVELNKLQQNEFENIPVPVCEYFYLKTKQYGKIND